MVTPIKMRMVPPMIFAMLTFPLKSLEISFPKKKPNKHIRKVTPVITRESQTMKIDKADKVIPTAKASIDVATPCIRTSFQENSFS